MGHAEVNLPRSNLCCVFGVVLTRGLPRRNGVHAERSGAHVSGVHVHVLRSTAGFGLKLDRRPGPASHYPCIIIALPTFDSNEYVECNARCFTTVASSAHCLLSPSTITHIPVSSIQCRQAQVSGSPPNLHHDCGFCRSTNAPQSHLIRPFTLAEESKCILGNHCSP